MLKAGRFEKCYFSLDVFPGMDAFNQFNKVSFDKLAAVMMRQR